MKKVIPILLITIALIIATFSSGCVRQKANRTPTISSTDGLIIKEFSSDLSRYEDTEPINVYLEIENVGGTTARRVNYTILGVAWNNTICWNGTGLDKCPQELGNLSPPDLSTQPPIPGDFVSLSWNIPPYEALPEGVELPVTITARVTYDYYSNGEVSIPVINKEYYKMLLKQNKPIPSTPGVKNSDGPIHIDIEKAGLPIIVEKDVDVQHPETAQIRIYIKNVGSGAPIKGYDIGNMTVNLTLLGTDVEFTSCQGLNVDTTNKKANGEIVLRRAGTVTIPCTIKITDAPELYSTISIVFETKYRYFIEKPLTVTIVGTSK